MRRRAGFTLVELMVALFIFGVIAAAGVALLTFSTTNRETVKAAVDQGAALQRTRQLLKADLGQAVARDVRGEGTNVAPAFAGPAGTRLFAVTRAGWSNHSRQPRASLQRVEWVLEDGELIRRIRPSLDGRTITSQVMLTGVRSASLRLLSRGVPATTWPVDDRQPLPDAAILEFDLERYGPLEQWFLVAGGPG